MRKGRSGFTLAEMLIVVVIAALVVVWSVPSFKRSQERARYDSAKGLLIDFGMAVQAMRGDCSACTTGTSVYRGTTGKQLTSSMQTTLSSEASICNLTDDQRDIALFARDYIPPVPLSTDNKYKNYAFYICPANGSTYSPCCSAGPNSVSAVACMYDANASSSYQKARFLDDTTIYRGEN